MKILRHALSLDERRIKFLPTYCDDSHKQSARPKHLTRESDAKKYEDKINGEDPTVTDALEVWFAGVHAGKFET